MRDRQHLLLEQCIGFLQLFVPEQKMLDAFCNLVDGGGIRHVRAIVISSIVGLVQGDILQWGLLVLETWFTSLSSTGSRRDTPPRGELHLRCPRNGQQTGFFKAPLSSIATECPETGIWEGDEGCSA